MNDGPTTNPRRRRRPTTEVRKRRASARRKIVDAANAHRRKLRGAGTPLDPLTMRHLERAVCIVRRARAVGDDVLVDAGFRGARR